MNALPHFSKKWFQLRQSEICKKLKNTIFKRTHYWLLSSRKLQNYFLIRLLWPNFDLNSFECFASLSQKIKIWSEEASWKIVLRLPLGQKRMFWAFEKGIFQFFTNFWVTKSKPFSGKVRQSIRNYLNQNLIIGSFL